ncbi:hypothetical protein ACF068_03270 [Streptomyces sp. NPDC016309]|uniref:LIC_13387 family protein n=1 Tax=Streptomyces sp. NPDC016309 TaxID=3364965 RepID=UPI0037001A32
MPPETGAGRAARRAPAAFRAGAWAWILTGAGHLTLELVMALRPEDPGRARAVAAMRAYEIGLGGVSRSLRDIDLGMSMVMGTALVFGGLICLLVARAAPALITGSRALSGPALAASLVVLGLSVALLPLPPVVLFTVACVGFGVAVATARPAASGARAG